LGRVWGFILLQDTVVWDPLIVNNRYSSITTYLFQIRTSVLLSWAWSQSACNSLGRRPSLWASTDVRHATCRTRVAVVPRDRQSVYWLRADGVGNRNSLAAARCWECKWWSSLTNFGHSAQMTCWSPRPPCPRAVCSRTRSEWRFPKLK